jgi:protease-4
MKLPGRNPADLLLELDLTRHVLEDPPVSPLDRLTARRTTTVRDLVEALEKAAGDDRVVGVVAHVGTRQPTLAQSTELRDAIGTVRRAGKATVCWSESYGPELGPGNIAYHLASAFEDVWLVPTGGLGLLGVSASAVFLRDALDKIGVQPQISQRREYKTAANIFLQTGLTEAHREMLTALAESATSVIVSDIATDRELSEVDVRAAIEAAPLSAQQAHERRLVDRLGYREEVYAALRQRLGDVERSFLERYARTADRVRAGASLLRRHRPVVGVVQASGPIHLGHSRRRTPLAGSTTGSDSVGAALRAAARDDNVKTVVLRVDSPGGSYVASDVIRREVRAVRDVGKPVVVSVASVAASGGYFVSMAADNIVAAPGTLTGSIGVLAGKQVIRDALSRAGIGRQSVSSAPHAQMFSSDRPFNEDEWSRLEDWLDRVYEDFTTKAAQDRAMPLDKLLDAARGRVWTGADAVRLGLVDQLGGLSTAIDLACGRAGIQRERARVLALPRISPLERLIPPRNSDSPTAASSMLDPQGSLLEHALALAGLSPHGALTMPLYVTLR